MASLPGERAPSVSLRHGVRCVPEQGVTVESVLLAVGEQVGCENIASASRMNKAIVVFLREEQLVARLIDSGIVINGTFCSVFPLATLTTKVTISNVPPFISDDVIERELVRYGKIASPIKTVSLGCKNAALKHVMSFRRQVFMFLKESTLDISFRVWNDGKSFMVYATAGVMKCFECGDIGHKQVGCPHKAQASTSGVDAVERIVRDENEQIKERATEEVEVVKSLSSSEEGMVQLNENVDGDLEDQEKVVEEQSRSVEVDRTVEGKSLSAEAESMSEIVMLSHEMLQNPKTQTAEIPEDDNREELRDEDTLSQMSGISDIGSQVEDGQYYSLQEINDFLDETFGKAVDIEDFFPDVEKFVKSVMKLQRSVGLDVLNEKKRFRLKKMLTKVRKRKVTSFK